MNKSTAAKTATPDLSRIVKRAELPKKTQALAKAGDYRVIHGNVMVPRFATLDETRAARERGEPVQEAAHMGDIIYLPAEDATRLLASNIVETLDAKPSRVGKVWEPPKATRNKNAGAPHVSA